MKLLRPELWRIAALCLSLGVCRAQSSASKEEPIATFGVTVVAPFGFCGRLYSIVPGLEPAPDPPVQKPAKRKRNQIPDLSTLIPAKCSPRLPDFDRLHPIGQIYTTRLDVPPRSFQEGFPGVTGQFEWFAIDYTARFWIQTPGEYDFMLTSDDGSMLYIDGQRVIDNDCVHPPKSESGSISLQRGIHEMRVSYFQGPRFAVALVLSVVPPGGVLHVFDTNEFKPPADLTDSQLSGSLHLNVPEDPCQIRRKR